MIYFSEAQVTHFLYEPVAKASGMKRKTGHTETGGKVEGDRGMGSSTDPMRATVRIRL